MIEKGDTDCGQGSACLLMIPASGSALRSAFVGKPARSPGVEAMAWIEADTVVVADHRAVDETEVSSLFQLCFSMCLEWVSRLSLAPAVESALPLARSCRQGIYIAARLFYKHSPHRGQ